MPASIGVNLRVTGNCRQGGRKYMEDCFSVAYQQTEDEKDLEYAFFGIYDGHGGVEAASFAKEHLMETIIKHKNFWSDNDEDVLRAIKDGYIATHYAMWREQYKWPRTSSGLPSTAGTTASVAFIRRGKIYIGHVGDSGIILGYQEPGSSEWRAKQLTKDHKPENPDEMKRIENCGGKVVSKSGVPRVVWNRPKIGHLGPVRRSTPIDEIPFLAVARSLGDLWSYNSQINQFVVSPDPDCSVLPIDTNVHRCLIFGTDGLFNMLSPGAAVHIVQQAERHNECEALSDDYNKVWLNPSKLLVERALDRWHQTKMRADNTSAVTLMLDPPGPPRAQVLKDRKKNLPESGLKIMTRYDANTSQESSTNQNNNSKCSEFDSASSKEKCAKPEVISNETSPHTNDPGEQLLNSKEKLNEEAPEFNSNISTSSAIDASSNLPLKERNFVPKPRESTSFDPREPYRVSEGGKENTSRKSEDNSIQIHEISSSNIEDSLIEDENVDVTIVERQECEKKPSKRKMEPEEVHLQQRKSLRLSLTQKFLEEPKKPAPCTLAEEKLKKLAEAAEKSKTLAEEKKSSPLRNNNNQIEVKHMSITQKILQSKKVELKSKSVRGLLTRKKLKLVLESVIGKNVRKKVGEIAADKTATRRSHRGTESNSKDEEKKADVEVVDKPGRSQSKQVEELGGGTREERGKGKFGMGEESGGAQLRGKTVRSKKVVVTGKLNALKRQSARNTSQRAKEVPVIGRAAGLSSKNAHLERIDKMADKKAGDGAKRGGKLQVLNAVRETRTSPAAESVKLENQSDTKENIKQGTLTGTTHISPKRTALKLKPPPLRSSLRQRIQDKTKTLKKSVLKRSR